MSLKRIPLVALACGLALAGCRQKEATAPAPPAGTAAGGDPSGAEVPSKPALLAEVGVAQAARVVEAPVRPDGHASDDGGRGLQFVVAERGGGVAWASPGAKGSLVVHNGRASRVWPEVGGVVVSPDGKRVAFAAKSEGKWRVVVDGVEGAPFDGMVRLSFSPDGSHLAYVAKEGDREMLVVDGTRVSPSPFGIPDFAFGAGGAHIAWIEGTEEPGWGRLFVSAIDLRSPVLVAPRASRLVANGERTRMAAVVSVEGGEQVITFDARSPAQVDRKPLVTVVYQLAFAGRGPVVAWTGERGGVRLIGLEGREEPLPDGFDPVDRPLPRPDGGAVGVFYLVDGTVRFRQFFAGPGDAPGNFGTAEDLVYAPEGGSYAFTAVVGERWRLVVNGHLGPEMDRAVTPQFTPDGKRVVYRARKGGKRFVVVADLAGRTLRQHPPYEQVFPVQFTADGKSVAYAVKDGPRIEWKVEPL